MRMKMIRDRRKSSQIVEASVEIHGEQVAADLETFFGDKLEEGETMPSFLIVFVLLKRLLASARQKLITLAAQHLRQIDSDDKARRRRNDLSGRLEVKGRKIRDVLDNLHGPRGGLEIAGLDRRTAQEPVDLLAQTERIIERFSTGDVQLGQPELKGFDLNTEALIADLKPDYDELSQLVDVLNRENRKSDATLIAKDEAQKEHDRIFRLVGTVLSAFYRFAGHDELARRVTPSNRRPGRTREEAETSRQATINASSNSETGEPKTTESETTESETNPS